MSTNKTFNKVQLDVKFTQATTRANLISEENISISFGKISKYFADLHSQAFTGYTHPTYTARTGKPTGNQTPGFGSTFTISQITSDGTGHVTAATDRTVKIPNTTMGAASADAAGSIGLVPAPAAGKQTSFLRGDGTWAVPTNTNTTYTIATGDSNGQIKVTPSSGSAYNVSVKGLGSAAYTASTSYVPINGKAPNGIGRDGYVAYAHDGFLNTGTGTVTGALVITTPFTKTKGEVMLKFTVDIYNYNSNTSVEYKISGYAYNDGKWYNCTAYCVSSGVYSTDNIDNLTVRFGYVTDGFYQVQIGETTTNKWQYPRINIHDITVAYTRSSYTDANSGWSVEFVTGGNIPNITQTITNTAQRYLPLSGGTMTGDITFAGISGNTYPISSKGIKWGGGTDAIDMYYNLRESDAGELIINMRDDSNVRISFAYNGTVKSYIDTNGTYNGNASTATKLGTANKGSTTKGIYLDAGVPKEMTYSLGSTVNAGTANQLAYYSGANAISATHDGTNTNDSLYFKTGTNAKSARQIILGIYGQTYGNDASTLISGTAGVFSYGDGGPQIDFNTSSSGSQAGALIFTDHDTAGAGASWHFVSNQSDWNVTSKRFHARTSISIGTATPNTSYNLYVNGTTNITGAATIDGTLVLSKTQDASGTTNNSPALIVGGTATQAHLELDNNEIMAKTNGTSTAALYINTDGGNVYINNNLAARHTATPTSGQVVITDGTTGGIKSSGYTIAKSVPSNAVFTDTTYSANNGVGLSGTTFYNSGVRAVSTGSANGTISVNTNGTSADVAVKGLASAAYVTQESLLRARSTVSTDGGATGWSQIGINQYNNAYPDGVTNKIYGWGAVVSMPSPNARFDLYYNHNSSTADRITNGLQYRTGWNDDKKAWRMLIDNVNYTEYMPYKKPIKFQFNNGITNGYWAKLFSANYSNYNILEIDIVTYHGYDGNYRSKLHIRFTKAGFVPGESNIISHQNIAPSSLRITQDDANTFSLWIRCDGTSSRFGYEILNISDESSVFFDGVTLTAERWSFPTTFTKSDTAPTNAVTATRYFALDNHTHNYAGSSSAGGAANSSNVLNSNTRMDYGWNGVNYFNISGTAGNTAKVNDTPTSAWWHIMRFNHGNNAGYYTDLAVPFNDVSLYYKRICGGAVQNGGWVKVLDALNIGYVMSAVIKYDSHARRFTSSKTNNGWNAQAYSNTGYADNVYVSFRPGQTTMYAMIGLDTNPSEDADYVKIDYCWYIKNDGTCMVYESGTAVTITGHTTYASGDEFRVEYSCGEIRYYHNGSMCRSITRAVSEKLYFDSSFYNAGNVYDFSYGTSTHSAHTAQVITSTYKSETWVTSLTNSAITLADASSSFVGWICGPTKNGRIVISSYQANDDKLYFGYGERGRTTNSYTKSMTWDGPTNTLTADKFVGALQGNVTGNCSGSSGSCTGTAANANKINTNAGATDRPVYFSGGVPVQCDAPASGSWWKGVPLIGTNGVTEIGRIIDFHSTNTSNADYDLRLQYTGTATGKTVTLPGATGTVALLTKGSTSYWGIIDGDGATSDWIRTTTNGFIPASEVSLANGGNGALGTSYWAFKTAYIANIYGVTIYENGTSLASKYAAIGHTHSYLPLSGGSLSASMNFKSTTYDGSAANNGLSSGISYPTTFNILDKSSRILVRLEGVINSSGSIGSYWYVRNYNTSGTQVGQKGISMTMAKDGTLTYAVSDGDKFRSAIGAGTSSLTIGTTSTTAAAGDHGHHLTSYSFTATQPMSSYVSFDQSSPSGAPEAAWFNGFISSHNNYVASYIINKHRTMDWYVGWGEWSSSTSSATAPTWYKLLHSGNTHKSVASGTTGGWSIIGIDPAVASYALKSIRINQTSPNWLSGDFGAGIAFGGADTKGVISMRYQYPVITFAGGNHSSSRTEPVWYIKISGTSGSTYNLDNLLWATLLKPISTTTTASASTWNIPSGSYQVWGERFSDTRLKYTPSGGTAQQITDTGDLVMWLTGNATSNQATLNMRIDGTYYGSFSGNITGNVSGNVTGNITGNVSGNVTGNVNGKLYHTGTSSSWWDDRDNAVIRITTGNTQYRPLWTLLTATSGSWGMGNHTGDDLTFNFISKAVYDSKANPSTYAQIKFTNTGAIIANGLTLSNSGYGPLSIIRTDPYYAGIKFYNNGTTYLGSFSINKANDRFVRFNTDEATSYEIIDRSVVRNNTKVGTLGWTSSSADTVIPTVNTIAFWNGAYSGTSSNLAYCNKGAFGTIVTKNTGDYLSSSTKYAGSSSVGGAATNVATEVGSSAGARPVFFAYLGDNTRVVYNTNFTYNPSTGTITANKFAGNITSDGLNAGIYDLLNVDDPTFNGAEWMLTSIPSSPGGTSEPSFRRVKTAKFADYVTSNSRDVLFNDSTNTSTSISLSTPPTDTQYLKLYFKSSGNMGQPTVDNSVYSIAEVPYMTDVNLGGILQVAQSSDNQGVLRLIALAFNVKITTGSKYTLRLIKVSKASRISGSGVSDDSSLSANIIKVVAYR